jgi:hypothetical protein
MERNAGDAIATFARVGDVAETTYVIAGLSPFKYRHGVS